MKKILEYLLKAIMRIMLIFLASCMKLAAIVLEVLVEWIETIITKLT